jgi:integrase
VKEAERQRQDARRRADTFAACFNAFAQDHLATLRTGKVVKATVEKNVFPVWAERPISEIKRIDVNELIRGFRKTAPIGANRLLAYLKKFFAWAVEQDLIEASPAAAIKKPSKENTRDRVLSEDEIKAIWQGCAELGAFGRAFRLMLLTGQRRTEVGRMAWSEIDWKQKTWSLSRARTKADRAHDVPLSDLAMSIIKECPKVGDYIFTTGRTGPVRNGAAKAQPISGWGKPKARLDEAIASILAKAAEGQGDDPPQIVEWHLHDLRRTCATYLAKLGTDRIVISKILNHAEGGVTGIYERHRYDAEKRRALELWSEHLLKLTQGESDNVVMFVQSRGQG